MHVKPRIVPDIVAAHKGDPQRNLVGVATRTAGSVELQANLPLVLTQYLLNNRRLPVQDSYNPRPGRELVNRYMVVNIKLDLFPNEGGQLRVNPLAFKAPSLAVNFYPSYLCFFAWPDPKEFGQAICVQTIPVTGVVPVLPPATVEGQEAKSKGRASSHSIEESIQ
jgi:hypothetical protein